MIYALKRLSAPAIVLVLAGLSCLLVLVSACGSSESDPVAVATLANDPDPGKVIFEANCLRCHPYGKKGLGPNLSKKDLTVEEVTKQVRKGGLIMPSFSAQQIPDEQLAQLAPFVTSLKPKLGQE